MFKAVARKGPKYIKKIKKYGAVSKAELFNSLNCGFFLNRLWNCLNQELGYSLMYHKRGTQQEERIAVLTVTRKLTS